VEGNGAAFVINTGTGGRKRWQGKAANASRICLGSKADQKNPVNFALSRAWVSLRVLGRNGGQGIVKMGNQRGHMV